MSIIKTTRVVDLSLNFKKILKCFFVIIMSTTLLLGCKNIDLNKIANSIQQHQQPLDKKTLVAGLKQALEIGTSNSVAKTSQKGGFNDNSLIHIMIPQELAKTTSTLNKYGFGRYVKRFELQMNRSAELASKQAKQIFIDSIFQMTLADAWGILNGADNAATVYFRKTTNIKLTSQFRPIVATSMQKIGFYDNYKKLLKSYNALPFTQKADINIENYIVQKTLDGLFLLIAQEEKKIRQNPAARVTDLLRKVFSN